VRNKRRLLVLTLALLPLIGLTVAFGQPGGFRQKGDRGNGGGGPPGGAGGPPGGNFRDPNFIFNMMSQGQDTIDVNAWIQMSSRRDPSAGTRIQTFLTQQNITSGRVTRDQFALYMQAREAERNGGAPPSGTPGAPGATPGGPPQIDDARIRDSFNRRDLNHDGYIELTELTSDRDQALRDEFDKWDKNHNGKLEFEEYKEYFLARMQFNRDQYGDRGNRGGPQGPDEFQQPEEEKQVVYRRLSDLPKELPPWFTQIPHNPKYPGQIALYEWKNAGRTVEEFRKYDRNMDGFITVEEVLVVERKTPGHVRPGANGATAAAEPTEEPLLTLAVNGQEVEDTTAAATIVPSPGDRGNRGNRGGPPNMGGNFQRGGPPGGQDRTGGQRGGPPTGGNFQRPSRGGR
jgi:hypothetical protein